MDKRLLEYYNQELRHLRQMGREFAEEFPKIAKRLDPDSFRNEKLCLDPYVERLLEGFAFLTARIQLKLDAEFPEFTQHLLEFVYPHYLAPIPSMTIVQVQPEGCPETGAILPRHTLLKSRLTPGEQTHCKYRTAHEVNLWPIEIAEAQYLSTPTEIPGEVRSLIGHECKAAIRLRLRTVGAEPLSFAKLPLDSLPIFLKNRGDLTALLYEQLLTDSIALIIGSQTTTYRSITTKPRRYGFDDQQALLPYGPRSFQGYRLLQEYFAFPERFLFIELSGLQLALQQAFTNELDLYICLKRSLPKLTNNVAKNLFALFCTPAINLFQHRADRIPLTHTNAEYQVIPDRTRMEDLEVYAIEKVIGYGTNRRDEQIFSPFYSIDNGYRHTNGQAYYTIQRRRGLLSAKLRQQGKTTEYAGTDVFISLVDAHQAPYDSDKLKEIGLELLCTNRDLAHKKRNQFTEFNIEIEAKISTHIECITGPTDPKPSKATHASAWQLISHLSLNYLSLLNSDEGASALRELLGLYCNTDDTVAHKQIEGIRSVVTRNVVRRVDTRGPIIFGRGVQITVEFDETAYEGSSLLVLAAVLDQFFARYASINTFTETVVTTSSREIIRWPIRTGQRHTI